MVSKKKELLDIIERAAEIKNCFVESGGEGIPRLRMLKGTKFEEWKADIKGLIVSLKQNQLTKSILTILDGFNGWTDESDFEKLSAELNTLYKNFEEYIKVKNRFHHGLMFEEFCNKLFEAYNLNVKANNDYRDMGYDFLLLTEDGSKYYTVVKFYRSSRVNKVSIKKFASQFINIKSKSDDKFLLIIASDLDENLKKSINIDLGVEILDISNILFLVQNNEYLSKEIQSLMNDTVIDWTLIDPKENMNLRHLFKRSEVISDYIEEDFNAEDLIKQFGILETGREFSRAYEELCTKALRYLFEEYLAGWVEQNNTIDDLHRMDLICRIKRGSEFWDFIKEDLKSRYILFEFKNYKDKIKQTQVYTTEKYLYKTALRTVCFLISREGASNNAMKAISGILRESGKLIIPLSDIDMINLLKSKDRGLLPEDYLSDVLDELLMKLPK